MNYKAKSKKFSKCRFPQYMITKTVSINSPHIEFTDSERRTHCIFFVLTEEKLIYVADRLYDPKTDDIRKEEIKISKESERIIKGFLMEDQQAAQSAKNKKR